jgi:EAL domain-containing protein (putative c-di-GMP-specific phosphodiesterase class I)/GGDEF domain-containing protein
MTVAVAEASGGTEQERVFTLHSTLLLDTEAGEGFDRLTRIAAAMFGAAAALVTLVDTQREWFKSRLGIVARQVPREGSFGHTAIQHRGVTVVEDARADARFSANPLVTQEGIRFYAGAPLRTESGMVLGTLCIMDREPHAFGEEQSRQLADLAALVVAQVELFRGAVRVDGVTHLPNGGQLTEDLRSLCALHPGEQRMLVLLEIMNHSSLQDAYRAVGHLPIEGLMRDAARKLRNLVDRELLVYYVGIARFAFILEGARLEEQSDFVDALVATMREPLASGHLVVELQMRAGMVAFTLDGETAMDAPRKATAALYQARPGSNALLTYEERADAWYRRSYALLRDLPRAMAEGELALHYQPKYNVALGGFKSAEALLRWTHSEYGPVPPGQFIPLVENTALIHDVTEWALHTAMAQHAAWRKQGHDISIAVNVSARNLDHPNFLRVLRNACAVHGVEPNRLQVECTENVALTGESTLETLQTIRDMGIKVSLDDFGIGYCNLSALSSLPAEMLKLDMSLVKNIAVDPRAFDVVKAIIALGHILHYEMLAEGVETVDVFDLLVGVGVDEIQGWFLSKAIPADQFLPFIEGWKKPAGK